MLNSMDSKNTSVALETCDDENNSEVSGSELSIQLGFAEPGRNNKLFDDHNWAEWDGGVIGGKPIWLNPEQIPSVKSLQCPTCEDPMVFLLQIYCPLDEPPESFHRALYVFCCKKARCVNSNKSIKCFRCQLPKINPFYPHTSSESTQVAKAASIQQPPLCDLCGCRAMSKCGRCHKVWYCSKIHQRLHWRIHKHTCFVDTEKMAGNALTQGDDIIQAGLSKSNTFLYPEYDLLVEDEELDDADVDAADESVRKANIWDDAMTKSGNECVGLAEGKIGGDGVEDVDEEGDEDDDEKLTQADYNNALGNEIMDPAYEKFLDRVRRGGSNQVLRYCRWQSAARLSLWTKNSESEPPTLVCKHCGAQSEFEFQIMPQLLHFLKVDQRTNVAKFRGPDNTLDAQPSSTSITESSNLEQDTLNTETTTIQGDMTPDIEEVFKNTKDEDIDWGTLDIYTCTRSCCGSSTDSNAYIEECLIRTPLGSGGNKKK